MKINKKIFKTIIFWVFGCSEPAGTQLAIIKNINICRPNIISIHTIKRLHIAFVKVQLDKKKNVSKLKMYVHNYTVPSVTLLVVVVI